MSKVQKHLAKLNALFGSDQKVEQALDNIADDVAERTAGSRKVIQLQVRTKKTGNAVRGRDRSTVFDMSQIDQMIRAQLS